MSRIQNIGENYEVVNLYKNRISWDSIRYHQSFYDPNLARAIITNVSESVSLRCYFYRPVSGTTVTIRNSTGIKGTGIFTIESLSPTVNLFIGNIGGTFTSLTTTLEEGDIVEYPRINGDLFTTVPADFPIVYGRCIRTGPTNWLAFDYVGDLTAIETVRFVFAVPGPPTTHVQTTQNITNVTSFGFDATSLSEQNYHLAPQFFYSITNNN